jgi:nitric oxide reductase NorD protein
VAPTLEPPAADPLPAWRARLGCPFPAVQAVFADCAAEAAAALSPDGLGAWLDTACALGKLGRGPEPVLAFLKEWPQVARAVGEASLADVRSLIDSLQKSPNGRAIAPFLHTLAAVARRLQGPDPLRHYLGTVRDLAARTAVSIHGHHATQESPGLPVFLAQAPTLLGMLTVAGLARWTDYGIRHHQHHPDRQRDYFGLQSADSLAVLRRERHGTLLADVERQLDLTLRGLWRDTLPLMAYSTGFAPAPGRPVVTAPYHAADGIRLPDVYDDWSPAVSGLDRYRAALAHMAGHRRWSRPLVADNLSPLQRLTVECLEDARIDHLVLRALPGLRPLLLALHPAPREGACDPAQFSCLRHRLTLLSRALLDPAHGYRDAALLACVGAFHALLAQGPASTEAMRDLALRHAARTRRQSDQYANVHFADTVVSYRDDNRGLWRFIEQADEEESFDEPAAPPPEDPHGGLPPRHYPEWDAATQTYRPDWVSVYEALHPRGDAAVIDALLDRHAVLARQLQRLLDLLKPQDRVRLRYQENGSELDLDVAIRSLIDWRAGAQPEQRILVSHRTDGRSIAVLLLLDLSESLNDEVPGTGRSRLALSQEAVALLAWAVDRLGDPFAMAGFHSNTRHDVRYQHILGFSERWGEAAKARLAALQAGYSTRMGAALRHAAHYLGAQQADKKLLLVLTDGQPADVDVADPHALTADTRQAVRELAQQGIHSHCISLDAGADAYVHDIFGPHATVVDRLEQLPERLSRLFMSLTR